MSFNYICSMSLGLPEILTCPDLFSWGRAQKAWHSPKCGSLARNPVLLRWFCCKQCLCTPEGDVDVEALVAVTMSVPMAALRGGALE